MQRVSIDPRALEIARDLHRAADAEQTILFGSRARGDYRTDSDLDILIVKDEIPPEHWLEKLRDQARELQKSRLPEASGIDVICMTGAQFRSQRNLKNNLANSIAKQGANVVPDENLEYGLQEEEENIDWEDVETKLHDAMGAARWLEAIAAAGILAAGDDKQIGRMAQNALENAYKAALGAHGLEYPASGRDGHNLRILTGLLREGLQLPGEEEVPGEQHRYLSEFGGAAIYAHEHQPSDRGRLAREVPEAVAMLKGMVEAVKP